MSAIQNILQGVKDQAQARAEAERKADIVNQQEKEAGAGEVEATPEVVEAMTNQQMQDAIKLLSKAVMELTEKSGGINDVKH